MSKIQLSQVVRDYVSAKVDLSPGYTEQLNVVVNLFGRFLQRPATCSDLNGNTVRDWMRWLLVLPRTPRTINGRAATLCSLWKFAHRRKLVKVGPEEIPKLREPVNIPHSYSDQQFAAMVSACTDHRHGSIMRALLLVLWDCGVRLSAVLVAKRVDFDAAAKTLTMVEPKTKKQSVYSLSDATVQAVATLTPDDGSLLGWMKSATALRNCLEAIQVKVGVPVDRWHKFHCVRKSKFTAVYRRFGLHVASQHLGHSCDLSRNYLDTRRLVTGEMSQHLPPPTKAAE